MATHNLADYNAAIVAMYGPASNEQERQQADKWLQHFCRSTSAWEIANAIIANPQTDASSPHMAFACKTLLDKISLDYEELPSDTAKLALREAVSMHVMRWGLGAGTPGTILKKLSLCLASLAVQMHWTDIFTYCTELIGKAPPGQEVNVTRLVLQLLAALPDACEDEYLCVKRDIRQAFREVLRGYIPQVMAFLQQSWSNAHVLANEEAVTALLECFSDWIRYCRVDPALLAQHPLLPAALENLANPNSSITKGVFEKTVDLAIEVFRTYDARPAHLPLVQVVVPHVMAMRSRYEMAVASDDEDQARELCRIFTEMAESYTDLLLSTDEMGQKALVELVLLCTSSEDTDIVNITFRFWYGFFQGWHRMRRYNEATDTFETQDQLKGALKLKYNDEVVALALQCLRLMAYPADYDQTDREEVENFTSWRHKVSEALEDCCLFLGQRNVISMIWQRLVTVEYPQLQASGDWRGLEGCLYALLPVMGSVAGRNYRSDYAPLRELQSEMKNLDDETAGSMLQLALSFQGVEPMWSSCGPLRATLSSVLGSLGPWFRHKNAAQHLSQAFNFLYANLTHEDKSVSSAAARAMRSLCSECGSILGEPVLDLYEQLQKFPRGHLNEKDELDIVDGLSAVANKLPFEGVCHAVDRMVVPLRDSLAVSSTALQTGRDVEGHAAEIRRCVDLFQHIVRNLTSEPPAGSGAPHPAVTALRMVWPYFDQLLGYYSEKPDMLEKIVKGYKYAMRSARQHFAPCLDDMISHLLAHFAVRADASFLYIGYICVTEFGLDAAKNENAAYGGVLMNMMQRFSDIAFGRLTNLAAFTSQPDMVEEYFFLVSSFLDYCPSQLLQSPLLGSIIQCGAVGLQIDHRNAHMGIMTFYYTIINCGLGSKNADQYRAAVVQVLTAFGQTIVRAIIEGLTSDRPAYGLDKKKASPATVLWLIAKLSPEMLHALLLDALSNVSPEISSEADRAQWVATLGHCITSQDRNAESNFGDAVVEFHRQCNRAARQLRRRTTPP